MSRNPDSGSVIQDPNNSAQHSRTGQGNGLSQPALVCIEPQRRGKSTVSGPISSSVDVGCIFYHTVKGRSSSLSFSADYGRVEAVIARRVTWRRVRPIMEWFHKTPCHPYIYNYFEKGCRKKCARDNPER